MILANSSTVSESNPIEMLGFYRYQLKLFSTSILNFQNLNATKGGCSVQHRLLRLGHRDFYPKISEFLPKRSLFLRLCIQNAGRMSKTTHAYRRIQHSKSDKRLPKLRLSELTSAFCIGSLLVLFVLSLVGLFALIYVLYSTIFSFFLHQ